jgi:hypothetical protein
LQVISKRSTCNQSSREIGTPQYPSPSLNGQRWRAAVSLRTTTYHLGMHFGFMHTLTPLLVSA